MAPDGTVVVHAPALQVVPARRAARQAAVLYAAAHVGAEAEEPVAQVPCVVAACVRVAVAALGAKADLAAVV